MVKFKLMYIMIVYSICSFPTQAELVLGHEHSISRNMTSYFHALRYLSELQLMVVVNLGLAKVDENQSFRQARDHR